MNPLAVYSALTIAKCDNKLPHKKGPSKLPFALMNCGKISFNLHFFWGGGASWLPILNRAKVILLFCSDKQLVPK